MKKKSRKAKRSFMIGFLAIFSVVLLVFSTAPVISCGIEETIRPGGTIIGVVRDAETSEPIPGALMTLSYHETVRTELTDAKGQYVFTNVPECFCLKNVSAQKRGYESQFKLVAVYKVTYVNFSLNPIDNNDEPTNGVITGIVTDAKTNQPISNALMTLKYHDMVRIDFTDSKGGYTFTNVPLCFCLKNISAEKRGYESQYKLVAVQKITYVNFSLNPIDNNDEPTNGVITGIVTDAETGDPLPDTLMTLEYHDIIRTELTDLKGKYTFTEVPICFCLKNVSASKKGYESQYQLVAVSEITYVNFSLNPVADDNQDANSIVSGETREKGAPIESNSYYLIIIGVIGAVITILIGINVYSIRRTNRNKR